jgi:hypothetical protein
MMTWNGESLSPRAEVAIRRPSGLNTASAGCVL